MAVVGSRIYAPESEAAPDWQERQDRLAARAVTLGTEGSREIRRRLERAGISPDDVTSVADLARIPVLSKDELPDLQADRPPFGGMLGVPAASLKRIYRSPGPIADPEGNVRDYWRVAPAAWAAGFRPGDVVLNAFSYHLTPGGLMLDSGLRAAGCVVLPGGTGQISAQIELARAAAATGYVGTPQFLNTILERAEAAGTPLGLRRALVTGAPLPPALRTRLQDRFDLDLAQSYGTADAGTLGYECELRDGWHVSPDVVIELVSPRTGRSAADGESGEVVVTSPNEVYPLVRFGTGDLSAWNRAPCPCGRTSPRLVGYLGRAGEGVKVRGMFVHPRELAAVLASAPDVRRFAAIVTSASATGGRDALIVRVEPAPGHEPDTDALAARIREAVGVRPQVEPVPAGSLPDDAPVLADERDDR